MHYHSMADVKYISDIKKALINTDVLEEGERSVELKVKAAFKQTDVYKGYAFFTNTCFRVDKTSRKGNDIMTARAFHVDLPTAFTGTLIEVGAFDEEQMAQSSTPALKSLDKSPNEIRLPILHRACDEIGTFRSRMKRQDVSNDL